MIVLYFVIHFLTAHSSVPGVSVHNFTVEVVYATSVELSWLPPDPQLWNGRITNYTVVYELLGPVGMTSDNSSQTIMTKAIPTQGNPLANNADPRLASVPLQWERVVVDELEEHHVYKFSVFIANAAGRSGLSMTIIQSLPGAGLPLACLVTYDLIFAIHHTTVTKYKCALKTHMKSGFYPLNNVSVYDISYAYNWSICKHSFVCVRVCA